MYQRGKSSKGSGLMAGATAMVVVAFLFLLIPLMNRTDRHGGPSKSGLGLITTAPAVSRETVAEPSISVRHERLNLADRGTIPAGWTAAEVQVAETPRAIQMPVLESFEPAERVETEFVFNVEDLDNTPTPFFRERPTYPEVMRRQAIEGKVVAEFRVDREGKTWDVVVVSSDHPEFSASVIAALKRWRFLPGRVDGQKVEFRMRIPMVFKIVSADPEDAEPMFAVAQ